MNQADHCAGAATGMGFSIPRDAFRGFDPHNNRVALGRTANAHRDRFALVKPKGKGNRSDRGDFHGVSRINVICLGLWPILVGMACVACLVVRRLGRIYSHLDWVFVSVCKSQAQAIAFDFASTHSRGLKAV